MNKTFKKVFNARRGKYVAVDETKTGHGQMGTCTVGGGSVKSSLAKAAVVGAMLALSATSASALDWGEETVNNINAPAYTTEGAKVNAANGLGVIKVDDQKASEVENKQSQYSDLTVSGSFDWKAETQDYTVTYTPTETTMTLAYEHLSWRTPYQTVDLSTGEVVTKTVSSVGVLTGVLVLKSTTTTPGQTVTKNVASQATLVAEEALANEDVLSNFYVDLSTKTGTLTLVSYGPVEVVKNQIWVADSSSDSTPTKFTNDESELTINGNVTASADATILNAEGSKLNVNSVTGANGVSGGNVAVVGNSNFKNEGVAVVHGKFELDETSYLENTGTLTIQGSAGLNLDF